MSSASLPQGTTDSELDAFFAKGWTPASTAAELIGAAYTYDEDGTLIAETSSNPSAPGITLYVYLPTPSGPMPVATLINGTQYAVHSDHLNTPRRLTSESGQLMWQWAYSAFGETAPTTAAKRFTGPETVPTTGNTSATPVTFNLRYPGQYADVESGLSYNYFRSYSPATGRYTQPDPIGMDGGWNRFTYAYQNPLSFSDPTGLLAPLVIPGICAAGGCEAAGAALAAGALWWANHNPFSSPEPMLGPPFMESRRSGKERATDVPSFARGKQKQPNEDCAAYAARVLAENYGLGHPKVSDRGPGSEYSKIKKNCERGNC